MQQLEPAEECGLERALTVIKGKWKPTIIWELHERPIRFGELKRRLQGITEKVLYEQLRQLELDGIVHREVYDELPARVEYSLTPCGAGLNAAVHELAEWGKRLPASMDQAQPAPPQPGVVRVLAGVRQDAGEGTMDRGNRP
jgi:DNA-binding HxlR family transcriptional regulator